jgi:hypothetical protein
LNFQFSNQQMPPKEVWQKHLDHLGTKYMTLSVFSRKHETGLNAFCIRETKKTSHVLITSNTPAKKTKRIANSIPVRFRWAILRTRIDPGYQIRMPCVFQTRFACYNSRKRLVSPSWHRV